MLDYFETDKAVDAKRVGLYGHSRWGKATLLASVLDTRFAIAYVSSSGQGGAKLHRRKYGETVDNVANTFYYWMGGNYIKYAGKWDTMPVDSHELVALMAPRPVFFSGGNDPQKNPDGTIATRVNDQGQTVRRPGVRRVDRSAGHVHGRRRPRRRSTNCSARRAWASRTSRRSTRRSSPATSASTSIQAATSPARRGRRSTRSRAGT